MVLGKFLGFFWYFLIRVIESLKVIFAIDCGYIKDNNVKFWYKNGGNDHFYSH